jgi:hypothetical protein
MVLGLLLGALPYAGDDDGFERVVSKKLFL